MAVPLQAPALPLSSSLLLPRALAPRGLRLRRRIAALHANDDELLRAITSSAGASLPAIRSYDADLASLTLVGAVGFEQAVTAAAADGGGAAEEHLSSGSSTMVVETVFPAGADERSTVSTRLILPAKRVQEKAKKLRNSLNSDILAGNTTNILAMTFRQVTLQKVWSYKLTSFCPGTERNMEDLAKPREAPFQFTVSSSDVRFLSVLAETICSFALNETERRCSGKVDSSRLMSMFSWLQKPHGKYSADSSMCVYKIAERGIVMNAMSQVDKFSSIKGICYTARKPGHSWWVAPNYPRLEKAGGPGLSYWTNEFVPAYRVQISADIFKDAKLEGWHKVANNWWEVLLTHYQMVELANVLDRYYEDRFMLPAKQLVCSLLTRSSNVQIKKGSSLKKLIFALVGVCTFIALSILAQAHWQHLLKLKTSTERNNPVSSTNLGDYHLQDYGTTEGGSYAISVVENIKDALGWPGDVLFDVSIGAWTGVLPNDLMNNYQFHLDIHNEQDHISNFHDTPANHGTEPYGSLISPETQNAECSHIEQSTLMHTSGMNNVDSHSNAQDIASFQVVLSGDGKIIGFQPTNRVAVNQWASNPLAKALYGGRKLSPGLFEPSLKIPTPPKVVPLELLMSANPESSFALARPIR
ncbi:uncharacterized protein LOC122046085 [Zingiber officinale]|uniref:uncharacterized protein LOC122046085 n=1 Tax=Zingiber officinale TaxID=94328 RepID=UPI001C4C80A0|nr:uncharacterized protein LOC122046085 [Zingiber officinale]